MSKFEPKFEQVATLYEILGEITAICAAGETALEDPQATMLLSGIQRLAKLGTSEVGDLELILMNEEKDKHAARAAAAEAVN